MAPIRCFAVAALLSGVSAVEVTPIAKVISLIDGLKKEVESEGKAEAKVYAKFACFCKDITKKKSKNIKKNNDNIGVLSANIQDKSQSKTKGQTEMGQRKGKAEKLSKDMQTTVARCAKEKAAYEGNAAELDKAISSLTKAIRSMEKGKGKQLNLLQSSVDDDLHQTLALAEIMNMISAPKHQAVSSMLQASVDPKDAEYDYHSSDIIETLEALNKDFKKQKVELDNDFKAGERSCVGMKKSLSKEMEANGDAIKAIDKNVQKLAKQIAENKENTVESKGDLTEDERYLKQMTQRCETRAKDWDQRSSMRNDEIVTLTATLKLLTGSVKGSADKVNKRALLQVAPKLEAADVVDSPMESPLEAAAEVVAAFKPVSFLQMPTKGTAFLAAGLSMEAKTAKKNMALGVIQSEGQRLGSLALIAFSQNAAADPWAKVKGLVDKLIQRLTAEATAEATKKGFCDTELGKSRKDRDFRFDESQDLSADLQRLEAKEDALTEEIALMTKQVKEENKAMKKSTEERSAEKKQNAQTLATAKEGMEALNQAISILTSFYKQASKIALIQDAAKPVNDRAGFSGSYKGKGAGQNAITDLLETIVSDFDRTLRTTEAAEVESARDFVKFQRRVKESISGKSTKKQLDEQDLKTTKTGMRTKMEDLATSQKLLDNALKVLEELRPTCIDTGMSFKERTSKREEEMKALTKALCILDENKVEPDCK